NVSKLNFVRRRAYSNMSKLNFARGRTYSSVSKLNFARGRTYSKYKTPGVLALPIARRMRRVSGEAR
ncbi:MAG: hypothetical protein II180_13320, partial [Proteobacteria bacterium]|nr:hypothetical protein [Pseudomonadota bacterium]